MRVQLTVWSDYVCPWCYIGLTELERLRPEFDFDVNWQPFLLRPEAPDTGWPLPEHIRARINSPDNPLKARAAALNLKMVEREHIPSSRRAHECTEFARAHGRLEAFHHSVLERYWSRGEDLSDWKVLMAAAQDAALDPTQMQAEVSRGDWKPQVAERLEQAHSVGVSAVPTFVVADRWVVQGAQEGQVFRQAFQRLSS